MTTLVSEAMNRSPMIVSADARVGEAAALARSAGTAHLLVMDQEHLVGILCGCDLAAARPEELVWERMSVPVVTIRPDATLDDAAATLCECGIGCLPVALGGLVLGTLSGEELARAGRPALLPHRRCHEHLRGPVH